MAGTISVREKLFVTLHLFIFWLNMLALFWYGLRYYGQVWASVMLTQVLWLAGCAIWE